MLKKFSTCTPPGFLGGKARQILGHAHFFRPCPFVTLGPHTGPFSSDFQGNARGCMKVPAQTLLGLSRSHQVHDESYNIFPFSEADRNFRKIISRFILVQGILFCGGCFTAVLRMSVLNVLILTTDLFENALIL